MTQGLPGVFVQGASWPRWLGVRPPHRPLAQSNASAAPHVMWGIWKALWNG